MNETFQISFPGLGIGEFTLNRVAFSIGSVEVRWYGILITLGIMLAFYHVYYRGKQCEGVVLDDIIDIGICTVFLGVVGARLYYVLTTLDQYNYKSFLDVIAIWNGGLAIYGGIIGGCLGIVLGCLWKKISWRKLFDMAGPGVMLAQAVGRWGNFCNGEAYGYPIGETTRFYFFNTEHILNSGEGTLFHTFRMGLYPNSWSTQPVYYHPTFFYECIWNLLGFVLVSFFYKHKKYNGQIALMYFAWYGFGRMFIEGLRTDSLYIPGTSLRISQCLGLLCFVVGSALLIFFAVWGKTHRFAPVFATAAKEKTERAESDIAEENSEENPVAEESAEDVLGSNMENIESEELDSDKETEEDENGKTD